MILGHTITLDPRSAQAVQFRRACGRRRYAYNWGLAEWQRMRKGGEKPSTAAIKRRWNAHRKADLLWTYDVTKCASGRAITDLGAAFANFFRDCKKPRKQRKFRYPSFKKKALHEGFALWNDQFTMAGKKVGIAKIGVVRMGEELRFVGQIIGATLSFSGGRWLISVQVETDGEREPAPQGTMCGVDFASRALAAIAGVDNVIESVPGPKGRREMQIERWICSECGAEHERNANAAITLRKLGTASAELTRGDMVPYWHAQACQQVSWSNREPKLSAHCAHLGRQ